MTAEKLMLISGVISFLLTISWLRNRLITEKHAIGWLLVATLLLINGLFPRLIMSFADASRLSYPSAVLFFALSIIYFFSMRVSRSLTDMKRNLLRQMQDSAIIRYQLNSLLNSMKETASSAENPSPRQEQDREGG